MPQNTKVVKIKIIHRIDDGRSKALEFQGTLHIVGTIGWTDDEIAGALLSLEVKANGVSGDAALASQRVHVTLQG